MESNEILIFLNTDLSKSTKIELRSNLSLREIVDDMKQKFNICHTIGCRLIDSSGGEIDDDDVEYLNPREPLFLSQGEELNLESSTVLYEYVRQLGKGGFGNVALCRNRITNEEVAVKSIPLKSLKSPDDINRIYNEIAVLRDLRHPNIVRLLDTFTSNDQICFVMEYCSGGELYDFIVEN